MMTGRSAHRSRRRLRDRGSWNADKASTVLTAMVVVVVAAAAVAVVLQVPTAEAWKLNVPRVLLPLTEEGSSHFKLFSEGGCFVWKSSRPEVVSVTPVRNDVGSAPRVDSDADDENGGRLGCSSAAIVSVPRRSSGSGTGGNVRGHKWSKTQAMVTAEDAASPGHVLRAEVIIDVIKTLQISTRTHELLLEEAPEEFSIRAYDERGNEFSTLQGIVFKWDAKDRDDVLRFISFRDSSYALEPALEALEARGQQGSKVLLEGIKTGSSKVSVRLVSKASPSKTVVPPAEVTVFVIANLFLLPQTTYVMMGGLVHYHAEQMKANKIHQISIDSSRQYYVQVGDDTIARMTGEAVAEAKALGTTDVMLMDKNVKEKDDGTVRPPTAQVHVVVPAYITINIEPHRNWNVIVGNSYELYIEVFDAENHRLFGSENLVAHLQVDGAFVEVLHVSGNGTHAHVTPLKVGTTDITATLFGAKDANGELLALPTPLKATAEMDIYEPIALDPELTVLPWDPVIPVTEQIAFRVRGSETKATFMWNSSNNSIATVTQNGVARTVGLVPGETKIIASMTRASHNRGTARVVVIPALALSLENHMAVEAEVGGILKIPVTFFGRDGVGLGSGRRLFTKCLNLPFKASITGGTAAAQAPFSVDQLKEEPVGDGCAVVSLLAGSPGFARLSVEYSYPDETGAEVDLKDSLRLGAFKPLRPLQPSEGTALLSLDSSIHLVWSGGPSPWIDSPEGHFHRLVTDDDSIVSVEAVKTRSDVYVYQAICRGLGSTSITLTVGNKPSKWLRHPQERSSTVTVVCGEPDKVILGVAASDEKVGCPLLSKSVGRVASLCYRDLKIDVSVLDSEGRKFNNISSLNLEWALSDENLGSLGVTGGVMKPLSSSEDLDEDQVGYRIIQNFRQVLKPKGLPGQVDVSVSLKRSSYLSGMGGYGVLRDTLELNLVKDAEISPQQLSIFLHPSSRGDFRIKHGSGFFDVQLITAGQQLQQQQLQVAAFKYHSSNLSVQVNPLDNYGEASLLVRDLCLTSKRVATAKLQVVAVDKVELRLVDKVQKGRSITARVRLLDASGAPIRVEDKSMIILDLVPMSEGVLKIKPIVSEDIGQDNNKDDEFYSYFEVKGNSLGTTLVTAVASYGPKNATSDPVHVQVFPPLRLEPRNITLIIGAKFQLASTGGPSHSDAVVEFAVPGGNSKIASANSVGVVTGLTLGSTRVVGRSVVGVDRATGERTVISEDVVDVHVVKFDGMRIKAPIVRLKVGERIPLTAVGLPDPLNQNPFSFGSAVPHLRLEWSLGSNTNDVAEILTPFEQSGVGQQCLSGGINLASVRLVGKKVGRVLIKLKAQISSEVEVASGQFQFHKNQEFQDQLEVQVFQRLEVLKPPLESNTLLMTTNSQHQLVTSYDLLPSPPVVAFEVVTSVSMDTNRSTVVTVSKSGLVTAGPGLGSCMILIKVVEETGISQQMSLVVEVKDVAFFMVNSLSTTAIDGDDHWGVRFPRWEKTTNRMQLGFLPRGLIVPLHLSYHDDMGSEFDAVSFSAEDVLVRPSRFDTNRIQQQGNETPGAWAQLEPLKEAFTVLRVSIPAAASLTDDFIVFDVRQAIYPRVSRLQVGEVVELRTLMASSTDASSGSSSIAGHWEAEPKGLISIDKATGLMTAIRSGTARVSYVLRNEEDGSKSNHYRAYMDVDIKPVNSLTFNRKKGVSPSFLTNGAKLQASGQGDVEAVVAFVPVIMFNDIAFESDGIKSDKAAAKESSASGGKPKSLPSPSPAQKSSTAPPSQVVVLDHDGNSDGSDERHGQLRFETHADRQASLLFSCRAKFVASRHSLDNFVTVAEGYDMNSRSYGCVFRRAAKFQADAHLPDIMFSAEVEILLVPSATLWGGPRDRAGDYQEQDRLVVPFWTGLQLLTPEVQLTNVNSAGEVVLRGLGKILDKVVVQVSQPHLVYSGRSSSVDDDSASSVGGNDSLLKTGGGGDLTKVLTIPLSIRAAFWNSGEDFAAENSRGSSGLFLDVSSPLSLQKFRIPIRVQFKGDQCANIELGWSTLLYFAMHHYQTLLLVLFTVLVCILISRLFVANQMQAAAAEKAAIALKANKDLAQRAAKAAEKLQEYSYSASSPPPATRRTSPNQDLSTYLWTVDRAPIYGSPSSPRRSPRPLVLSPSLD